MPYQANDGENEVFSREIMSNGLEIMRGRLPYAEKSVKQLH
jgi:hypothetical protein